MLLHTLLGLGCATLAAAKSEYVGMNIAGLEFGCLIDGTCPLDAVVSPNDVAPAQMDHFVNDDLMNIFRLPVSWQFLTNNVAGAKLDADALDTYDTLVQACLDTGASCVIDIHNFARFNGLIIGQGGPTNAQFADLWTQLATKYKKEDKIMFGIMNEPHDLDLPLWVETVQAAVTAIRKAGATSQVILLPGTNFASAVKFVSSGSGDLLIKVTNPDGSIDGLILDVHAYLDVDNSGSHPNCVTDNIDGGFAVLAPYLRLNKRTALLTETGAGVTDPSCFKNFCAQNTFLNNNSDVILGYIAWAAGVFEEDYILRLTPTLLDNGTFVDNAMESSCVVKPWLGTVIPTRTKTTTKSTTASTTGPATGPAETTLSSNGAAATTFAATTIGSGSTPNSANVGTGQSAIGLVILAGCLAIGALL